MSQAWNTGVWIGDVALAAAVVAGVVMLFVGGLWPVGVIIGVALGLAVLARWAPLDGDEIDVDESSHITERLGTPAE